MGGRINAATNHMRGAGRGNALCELDLSGSQYEPLDVPRWDTLVERHDANKDGMLAVTEMPREEGVHLRPELPKERPGAFVSWPEAMAMVDGNKNGVVNKGEWDAFLAFLRSNEDNVMAIRPGGMADRSNTHVAWKASRGISEMPSPLLYRGRLYFCTERGHGDELHPDSGKVVLYRQRLGTLGRYVASPVAADGRIYAASETGQGDAMPPTPALAAGKRAFYAQMDLGVAQAYELASGVIAASFAHQEGRGRHGRLHRQARPTGPVTAATVAPRPPPRPAHRASWTPGVAGAGDLDDLAGRRDQRDSGAQFVDGPERVSCDVREHRRHLDERQMLGASLPRQKRCPVQRSPNETSSRLLAPGTDVG